ncbi:MAG: hypothetical protein ACRD0W_01690 [Acidimicrobiales bacterium]
MADLVSGPGATLPRRPGLRRRLTRGARRVRQHRTPEHPHTWVELLTLVGVIRRIAYDIALAPDDAMRRIRDEFDVYDGRADGEGSSQ